MERRIVSAKWYTAGMNPALIGIVQTAKDDPEEVSYWIGTGFGEDEAENAKRIADYGAKFPKEAGDILFKI